MYISAFQAIGHSGTTTIRKIERNADRTSVSAISFGVRLTDRAFDQGDHAIEKRFAGSAVIFTTMRSEMTRVPPVTPERSPPASRMTGADSPVIADFIDRCDAFDNLSVTGNDLARRQLLPCRQASSRSMRLLRYCLAALRRKAGVSLRALRSDSAWALPRASARAVAKLANSTVSHSQKSSAMK